jgi:uncharacterized phiE125 gp8 family phage protein
MRLRWHGHITAQATAAPLPSAAVSADDLAAQLRVSDNAELALIDDYARAATGTVERRLNRLLVQRQVTIKAAALPPLRCPATLYGGAVAAVTAFTVDGETVAGSAYDVVGDSPAVLVPDEDWPIAVGEGLPVAITYTAGYAPGSLPPDLRVAILMIGADMFENRTQNVVATVVSVNPAVDALLMPWRIMPT